jgi:hypothetical protein
MYLVLLRAPLAVDKATARRMSDCLVVPLPCRFLPPSTHIYIYISHWKDPHPASDHVFITLDSHASHQHEHQHHCICDSLGDRLFDPCTQLGPVAMRWARRSDARPTTGGQILVAAVTYMLGHGVGLACLHRPRKPAGPGFCTAAQHIGVGDYNHHKPQPIPHPPPNQPTPHSANLALSVNSAPPSLSPYQHNQINACNPDMRACPVHPGYSHALCKRHKSVLDRPAAAGGSSTAAS